MDVPAADEKLLKALAIAIVDHPRGTLKDIAGAAGISKATLNRFCGTRENLINRLLAYGGDVMNRIIIDADLTQGPPHDVLGQLVEDHLTHREMMVFLIFQWKPDWTEDEEDAGRWRIYSDALDAFFLRGQREGVFRIDISAAVLTEMFASILFGLVEAERRGRVARVGMGSLLTQFFLNGAAARA
jgi:TetR/AcrR family transcriptional regulator, mexCD-oprJ operon repressor